MRRSHLLAGAKDLSELRAGKSVKFSAVEVMTSSNLQLIPLEVGLSRCSIKEEMLRSSSNSLSGQVKTK